MRPEEGVTVRVAIRAKNHAFGHNLTSRPTQHLFEGFKLISYAFPVCGKFDFGCSTYIGWVVTLDVSPRCISRPQRHWRKSFDGWCSAYCRRQIYLFGVSMFISWTFPTKKSCDFTIWKPIVLKLYRPISARLWGVPGRLRRSSSTITYRTIT